MIRSCLFGSEDTVACIAKTRADVSIVVQLAIQMTYVDMNVGMCIVELLQAFRSSDDAHKFDVDAAVLFDLGDRIDS